MEHLCQQEFRPSEVRKGSRGAHQVNHTGQFPAWQRRFPGPWDCGLPNGTQAPAPPGRAPQRAALPGCAPASARLPAQPLPAPVPDLLGRVMSHKYTYTSLLEQAPWLCLHFGTTEQMHVLHTLELQSSKQGQVSAHCRHLFHSKR